MPYSFTEIERTKTKTIALVFCLLIIFYFLFVGITIFLISTLIIIFYVRDPFQIQTFFVIGYKWPVVMFLVLTITGLGFWFYWYYDDFTFPILKSLKAQRLQDDHPKHRMFLHILEEISMAIGGKKIRGYIIPFSAINFFGLENFRGRAVIGITEGALDRLNRSQIEAAVAHEAAHIATGDCLSTTVAIVVAEFYYFLRIKFLGLRTLSFISREQDYRADAIAVRLTRDPISLAEALYKICNDYHSIGTPGFEKIFIVDPSSTHLDQMMGIGDHTWETHAPVSQRIGILLDMARVDLKSFEKSLEKEVKAPS